MKEITIKENSVQKLAIEIESKTPKKIPKYMRGDIIAFFIVPLIFMILVFITSVVLLSWQTVQPIESGIMANTVGFNAINSTFPNQHPIQAWLGIGNQLYSFDYYLPFIFYMLMMAIIFSTVLLQPDPISWLVGVFYLPVIYYVSAYISNMAHAIFTQTIIAGGVSHLPYSIQILANLATITFLFSILYVIAIAIRMWFYPQQHGGQQTESVRQQASLR